MKIDSREKLYKLVTRKGISCPNPKNYPRRFDLYVKINRLDLKDFEDSNLRFFHIMAGLVCIMLMLSILSL